MRMISLIRKTILLLSVVCSAPSIAQQRWKSRQISTVNGMLNNTVYDILQDKYGFMWIGTSNGICRYDGYSFVNFLTFRQGNAGSSEPKDGMSANMGRTYMDKKNQMLWLHTTENNIGCYDISAGTFVDYTGRGDDRRTYWKFEYTDGHVWLRDHTNGARHIACHDGRFTCTDYNKANGQLVSDYVEDVVMCSNGNTWLTTRGGLYLIDDSGKARLKSRKFFLSGDQVGQDQFLFCTPDRIVYAFDGNGRQIATGKLPSVPKAKSTMRSHGSWCRRGLLIDGQGGYLATLTRQNGKYKISITAPKELKIDGGVVSDSINGNIFFSNMNGDLRILTANGRIISENLLNGVNTRSSSTRKYWFCHIKGTQYGIATYGNGMFIYDLNKGIIEHHTASEDNPLIETNLLRSIMADSNGGIWISQEDNGIAYLAPDPMTFITHAYPDGADKTDLTNSVWKIFDIKGQVKVQTKDNKVYDYSPQTGALTYKSTLRYSIYATCTDRNGNLWTGTRGSGLFIGDKSMYDLPHTKGMDINDVYDIMEDRHGRIWVATIRANEQGGIFLIQPYIPGKPLRIAHYLEGASSLFTHDLGIDRNGILWAATHGGLYCVDTNKKKITSRDFRHFSTSDGTLPSNFLTSLRCANDGSLWVGGTGTGLLRCRYNSKTGELSYTQLTKSNGLGSNNVSSIAEDRYGNVWAGTDAGLAHVDKRSGRIINHLTGSKTKDNFYLQNSVLTLADGRILFGTNNGMVIIRPQKDIIPNDKDLYLTRVTDVYVNGKSLYDGTRDEPSAPTYTAKRLTFTHDENSLTIYFSNFKYSAAGAATYQYYMEGADKGWRRPTTLNYAEYSSLPPGNYTFHIRTLSGDNKWINGQTLHVSVLPPWWATWWAWCIYLLIVGCIAYYIYYNWKAKFKLRQHMEVESKLNELRLNFFTHVSHEFRTPLSIIQAAANKIENPKTKGVSHTSVETVKRSSRRLLRLANQLMEFRRISTSKLRLQVEDGDIVKFIRILADDFFYAARQKNIQIAFLPFDKSYVMPFDKQKVETIVYNLISNAIKYTPEKGRVKIALSKTDDRHVAFTVEDSGNGIDGEQEEVLFQPFMHGYVSQGGMGIGLYVARNMAESHKGTLEYSRSTDLGGAKFVLTLPSDGSEYAPDDYNDTSSAVTDEPKGETKPLTDIKEILPPSINEINVAVIEDDLDMLDQLRSDLGPYFKVTTYTNGTDAIRGIADAVPSLVFCDVMLPDINGYDIVKQLKASDNTKGIPVIMLTALNDDAHQIRGYKAGADDYMVKPYNPHLLILHAANLIRWTMAGGTASDNGESNVSPIPVMTDIADRKFKDKLRLMAEQHYRETDFTIDKLAELMNMGRTKLYGKIKELEGVTPSKYINDIRMRKAAELIETGDYNINEIPYMIGLTDVSYFGKCFKAFYGVSPGRYAKGERA